MKQKMSLLAAISMAVGTMIGASIFSIFGVGAKIAGRELPEVFVLSSLYALVVAYSYARLGRRYISNAGPIAFILHGMGDNLLTGTLSVLMWLTYVVSIALFARGLAGYFLPLVRLPVTPASDAATVVAVIGLFMLLNFFGSKAVGKAETVIVMIKLAILGVFVVGGFMWIKPANLVPTFTSAHVHGLLYGSVIFFLSYMGFGLVTNASENIRDAEKNVPRAIYISIGIVTFVYIMVALVAVGNLSIAQLVQAKENALAIAAKPFLGHFGFLLISIGAVFSISSALNATIYGGANIAYSLAKDGELPEFFERKVWFKSSEGLYLTAGLSMVLALLFNIDGIASITSTIYTLLYVFVVISHYRLRREVGGHAVLLLFNILVLIAILLLLLWYQWQTKPITLAGLAAICVGAALMEAGYRYVRQRSFNLVDRQPQPNHPPSGS